MRIPHWTSEAQPRAAALVDAIKARRGGELINLDRALLWSEPLARAWNVYLKAVRTELGASRKLRELGICTVALLTGAAYEYHHHAPDFIAAGGTQAELDLLNTWLKADARGAVPAGQTVWSASAIEPVVVQFAAQMTLDVVVSDATFKALSAQISTSELVELTAAIATYNMVARFLVALDVNIERT